MTFSSFGLFSTAVIDIGNGSIGASVKFGFILAGKHHAALMAAKKS